MLGGRPLQHRAVGHRLGGDPDDGPPVLLNTGEAPTFCDPQAAITWSSSVRTQMKADVNLKSLIGKSSGETIQMGFSGQGWVLVQPSEGRIQAAATRRRQRRRWRAARPARRLSQELHAASGAGPQPAPGATLHSVKRADAEACAADDSCPVCATAELVCGQVDDPDRPRPRRGPQPLLRARALARGHQPAHAVAAPARARGRGRRRARHAPRGAAAGRVLAHGEGLGPAPADRGHAPLRARLARCRSRAVRARSGLAAA